MLLAHMHKDTMPRDNDHGQPRPLLAWKGNPQNQPHLVANVDGAAQYVPADESQARLLYIAS